MELRPTGIPFGHFAQIRDAYGRKIRMLTIIAPKGISFGHEYTHACLVIHCAQRIGSKEVIEQLADAMIIHGIPQYIRSDNVLNARTFSGDRQSHPVTAIYS